MPPSRRWQSPPAVLESSTCSWIPPLNLTLGGSLHRLCWSRKGFRCARQCSLGHLLIEIKAGDTRCFVCATSGRRKCTREGGSPGPPRPGPALPVGSIVVVVVVIIVIVVVADDDRSLRGPDDLAVVIIVIVVVVNPTPKTTARFLVLVMRLVLRGAVWLVVDDQIAGGEIA